MSMLSGPCVGYCSCVLRQCEKQKIGELSVIILIKANSQVEGADKKVQGRTSEIRRVDVTIVWSK